MKFALSSTMPSFLAGRTALVTGATRGIGYAIASQLAQSGADVLINGRTESTVAEAAATLRASAGPDAGQIDGRAGDISKWDQVEELFHYVGRKWNKLDILVNNAGLGIFRSVADLAPEDWRQVIEVNLNGVFYCSHAAMPLLRASGQAYVFNISSLAGRNPFAGGAAYNASKFAVNGFTEAMMLDHRQDNVRLTTIMPGSVDTSFGGDHGQNQPSAAWKIQPEDIAEIVVSLLRLPSRTLVSRVEVRPSKPPA